MAPDVRRDGRDDPNVEAEGEVAWARLAFHDDDAATAAVHLAAAYAHCPDGTALGEAHEMLAALHRRLGPALPDAFPLDEPTTHVGVIVARAYATALAGDRRTALGLFLAASRHEPARPWARADWLTDDAFAAIVDPDALAAAVLRLCTRIGGTADGPTRVAVAPYLDLMRRATAAHPAHGVLAGAASALARRVGESEESVALARRAVAATPSMLTEMWLGYALRDAGRRRAAIDALRRAIGHEPANLELHADLADVLHQSGRNAEAIRVLTRARELDPAHDCTAHTLARVRFADDRHVRHLVALVDFAREQPPRGACRHTDLAQACHGVDWLGHVPMTMAAAPAAGRRRDPFAAFERWRSDEPPTPTGPPPAREVAQRVAALSDWRHADPVTAYDRTISLAGLPIADLVRCVLAPPPATEAGFAGDATGVPGLWARSVRVTACLGILHQSADEEWASSRRRAALVGLLADGTGSAVEAAAFGLVVAAWIDPAARADVARALAARFDGEPAGTSLRPSLAALVLVTPEVSEAARRRARRALGPDGAQWKPARRRLFRVF